MSRRGETEDGLGWGGLAASKAELRAEKEHDAELTRLRAQNEALKRDLQYARDGLTKGRTRMREDIERLTAENAALKREAHTWWTAARDAAAAERRRCALRVAIHSQYPITTDFDRGYDKARKDAAETLRTMDAELARPPTPVGWSDTDWLAHLESLRQNEAAYDKGPLLERGWD